MISNNIEGLIFDSTLTSHDSFRTLFRNDVIECFLSVRNTLFEELLFWLERRIKQLTFLRKLLLILGIISNRHIRIIDSEKTSFKTSEII